MYLVDNGAEGVICQERCACARSYHCCGIFKDIAFVFNHLSWNDQPCIIPRYGRLQYTLSGKWRHSQFQIIHYS